MKEHTTRPRMPRVPLLIGWLAALLLLGAWTAANVRPQTSLAGFLPRVATLQERVMLAQLGEGVAARTLLIRIGGASVDALTAASRALANRLEASGLFLQVANGRMPDMDALAAGDLFRYRYLIGPAEECADALTVEGLRAGLRDRLEELRSGAAVLDKARIAADPVACFRGLWKGTLPAQGPRRLDGVWVDPDARHALLVAVTAGAGSDPAQQRRAVEAIRAAFDALPGAGGLALELAGPAYFAVGSEARIKAETRLLGIAAGLVVAVILVMAFRSLAVLLLGMLPILSGVLAGIAAVQLLFGAVHGITVALGLTLLGVALDYPVHIFAHAGSGADGSAPLRAVGATLLLGMLTTALGYAALAWTSFDGLVQLGVLASVGLAVAAAAARWLLPLLLPTGYHAPRPAWAAAADRLLPRVPLLPAVLLPASTGVLLLLVLWHHGDPRDADIGRLGAVPQAEMNRDRLIRTQLGQPDVSRLLYVVARTPDAVLQRLEELAPDLRRLMESGGIGGFDSTARLLPSFATQRARQAALPDRAALTAMLAQANEDLPFRIDGFAPFVDAVQAARALPPLRPEALADTALGIRASMLLQPFEGGWLGLVPLVAVSDDAVPALKTLAGKHGADYLDLRASAGELLDRFFGETLQKLLWAAAVLLLVLVLALRDGQRLLRVLLPIVAALALTVVGLVLTEGAINLFHLVSLLLVTGIALDFGLFLSRPPAQARAESRDALFAVGICAASSFAMFALLALSGIPALRAIGFTVALGIAAAYPIALLLARPAHARIQ